MGAVDFSTLLQQAKTVSFDALPKADYTIQIVESEATSTQGGKDMIKVKGAVVGGPYNGKKVFNNFVLSPESDAALAIFFRQMGALGVDEGTILQCSGDGGMARLAALLQNRTAVWSLDTREWGGTTRNEVKAIKPLPAGSGAPPVAGLPAPTPAAPTGIPAALPGLPGMPQASPTPTGFASPTGLPGLPGTPAAPTAANGAATPPPALPGMPALAGIPPQATQPDPAAPQVIAQPQPTQVVAPQVPAQPVTPPAPAALVPIAVPPAGYEAYAAQWPTFTPEQQHQVYQAAGVPVPASEVPAPPATPAPPPLPF
jgi:hypothetical protein